MSFPDKWGPPPGASDEPDFYRDALNQIHRDAQADITGASSAAKRAEEKIRSAVRTVTRTFRPQDRNTEAVSVAPAEKIPVISSPAVPTAVKTKEKTAKPAPVQAPASPEPPTSPTVTASIPEVSAAETPPADVKKDKIPSRKTGTRFAPEDTSRKRAEKTRRNRTAAQGKHLAHSGKAALPTESGEGPIRGNEADVGENARRKASRRKKPRAAVLLMWSALLLTGLLMGVWILFGYRSCEATARRFVDAMYRADAKRMYALWPEDLLDDTVRMKHYEDRTEFFADESTFLRIKWRNMEDSIGKDWTVEVGYRDVSAQYEKSLTAMADAYMVDYGTRPAEVRQIMLTAMVTGDDGEVMHSHAVVMMRFGTWWYVCSLD